MPERSVELTSCKFSVVNMSEKGKEIIKRANNKMAECVKFMKLSTNGLSFFGSLKWLAAVIDRVAKATENSIKLK